MEDLSDYSLLQLSPIISIFLGKLLLMLRIHWGWLILLSYSIIALGIWIYVSGEYLRPKDIFQNLLY